MMSPYSATKAAVIAFTKSVGKEVGHEGICVNAVAPAVIRTHILDQLTTEQVDYMTQRIPMRRTGTPEEIAAVVHFLRRCGSRSGWQRRRRDRSSSGNARGRNRYGRDNARGQRPRGLLQFDRLLFARDDLFALAGAGDTIDGFAGIRALAGRNDLGRCSACLDDRRQRGQHGAAEHGAVGKCAGRSDAPQDQARPRRRRGRRDGGGCGASS